MDPDKFVKAFGVAWVLLAMVSLGFLGLVAWVIIRLVTKVAG